MHIQPSNNQSIKRSIKLKAIGKNKEFCGELSSLTCVIDSEIKRPAQLLSLSEQDLSSDSKCPKCKFIPWFQILRVEELTKPCSLLQSTLFLLLVSTCHLPGLSPWNRGRKTQKCALQIRPHCASSTKSVRACSPPHSKALNGLWVLPHRCRFVSARSLLLFSFCVSSPRSGRRGHAVNYFASGRSVNLRLPVHWKGRKGRPYRALAVSGCHSLKKRNDVEKLNHDVPFI